MSKMTPEGHQITERSDVAYVSQPKEGLSPFLVLLLLSQGVFPWSQNIDGQHLWWSPEPRSILLISELRVSRSLRKLLRSGRYRVTADRCFDMVVTLCGELREDSWITHEYVDVLSRLHRMGHAHSIEVWEGDQLVGGLFGICVGEYFCGCSMFHTKPNASKVALVKLCELLAEWRIPLIDCQMHNPHLQSLGARVVPKQTFTRLATALSRQKRRVGGWSRHFT